MDCEGCEYHLIDEADVTLRKMKQMQIEFHNGSKRLVKRLERAGFKVRVERHPIVKRHGYIYAGLA
jgi:hypothetical protein